MSTVNRKWENDFSFFLQRGRMTPDQTERLNRLFSDMHEQIHFGKTGLKEIGGRGFSWNTLIQSPFQWVRNSHLLQIVESRNFIDDVRPDLIRLFQDYLEEKGIH